MAKKNKTKKTEIITIIDTSGSMGNMVRDCVGTFNTFVEELQAKNLKGKVTLVGFDNNSTVVIDRQKLGEVQAMPLDSMKAGGGTALYDAIGETIAKAKKDRPTICMIQTDGQENGSREYTQDQVKSMIEEMTALGWEFQFTGVGIDGFANGGRQLGLERSQTRSVSRGTSGIKNASAARSMATMDYMTSNS